jgi:hypothetical protein
MTDTASSVSNGCTSNDSRQTFCDDWKHGYGMLKISAQSDYRLLRYKPSPHRHPNFRSLTTARRYKSIPKYTMSFSLSVFTFSLLACSCLAKPSPTLEKRVTFSVAYAPESSPGQPRDAALFNFQDVGFYRLVEVCSADGLLSRYWRPSI